MPMISEGCRGGSCNAGGGTHPFVPNRQRSLSEYVNQNSRGNNFSCYVHGYFLLPLEINAHEG